MRPVVLVFTIAAAALGIGQDSVTSFATHTSVQALTFRQGDRDAFTTVRRAFTAEGWAAFQADMRTWVDADGAPTFGSSFVPKGNPRVVDERVGVVHVRVPGTLIQTQKQAKTTYTRFAVDVWISGEPARVQKLTQTTCVAASTACQ